MRQAVRSGKPGKAGDVVLDELRHLPGKEAHPQGPVVANDTDLEPGPRIKTTVRKMKHALVARTKRFGTPDADVQNLGA
jgi:hypothetical protein